MLNPSLVVVGAGVIGLTCALEIAEAFPALSLVVVAQHLPTTDLGTPQYTSPWAGAHFRPFPNVSGSDYQEAEWPLTRATQTRFRLLAASSPESSIRFIKGVEVLEAPNAEYAALGRGYTEGIEGFRVLKGAQEERVSIPGLPQALVDQAKLITEYDTWVLNAPVYLQYLYARLVALGVTFRQHTLKSLAVVRELYPSVQHIINCSGTGLLYQGGHDPLNYAIRGQTLLLRPTAQELGPYLNKTITHQSKEGKWTFIIPRPLDGGLILGGTKQVGDSTDTPKAEDTALLLAGAQAVFPLLGATESKIARINVGFRPARKTGFRLEAVHEAGVVVVHAYGAGGMGYELSYGVAEQVKAMVARSIRAKL